LVPCATPQDRRRVFLPCGEHAAALADLGLESKSA
jgi:hypothetical protein